MANLIILVFIGGAIGAMLREFLMLMIPPLSDGFPMDIFVANIVAAFLLGLVTALHARTVISDNVNTLVGTGVMGGLSTFSSFAYGAVVVMTASREGLAVSLGYVVASLALGYIAVIIGLKLGGQQASHNT